MYIFIHVLLLVAYREADYHIMYNGGGKKIYKIFLQLSHPVSRALSRAAECYPLLPSAAMAAYLSYPGPYIHKADSFYITPPGKAQIN